MVLDMKFFLLAAKGQNLNGDGETTETTSNAINDVMDRAILAYCKQKNIDETGEVLEVQSLIDHSVLMRSLILSYHILSDLIVSDLISIYIKAGGMVPKQDQTNGKQEQRIGIAKCMVVLR